MLNAQLFHIDDVDVCLKTDSVSSNRQVGAATASNQMNVHAHLAYPDEAGKGGERVELWCSLEYTTVGQATDVSWLLSVQVYCLLQLDAVAPR